MTEFSGTLEGMGLPAVVRFISGLKKTGSLRIVQQDWSGEVCFELGQVTGASLGSHRGLPALDAMVQVLSGGRFTFDVDPQLQTQNTITLTLDELQAHLDELVARMASGRPPLPSADAVPGVLAQPDASVGEESLALDRGMLQTLLAIDGQRSVGQVVGHRGTVDAWFQLARLVELRLIGLGSGSLASPSPARTTAGPAGDRRTDVVTSVPTPAVPPVEVPAGAEPQPVEARANRSVSLEAVADMDSVHCPKLGFEDDPNSSFGRPTRMHRCFAAELPLPLSLDQQRELCLSDHFSSCPRLTMSSSVPAGRDHSADAASLPVVPRLASRPPEAEADDPRILRLASSTRGNMVDRGAIADRQAVGDSPEPMRFRPSRLTGRDATSPPPTQFRGRIERANAGASNGAVNGFAPLTESTDAPTGDPVALEPMSDAVAEAPATDSPAPRSAGLPRRIAGVPIRFLAAVAVAAVVLLVVGYMVLAPRGGVPVERTGTTSGQPSTGAGAASAPNAQPTVVRSVAEATPPASELTPGQAAAAARPVQTSAAQPGATQTGAAQTGATQIGVSQTGAAQTGATQTGAAQTGAAQAAAANMLLDEHFVNNDRNWPSAALGPAFVTGGGYHLAPLQAGQFVAVGAPIADVFTDVIVSATFHKLGGPAGGGYGIIVRDQAAVPQNGTSLNGNYYVLEAGDTGEVGIWRRDGDHWADLLAWQPIPAVKPGTASNELSVRAIGSRLTFSVNGTEVATGTDGAYSSGGVGLFVGGDGNQVSVDRFSIQRP